LFERIRRACLGNKEPLKNEDLAASLEKHLSLILNTRQGSSGSAPDYGMPDFATLMGKGDLDGIRELSKMLTEVVRKYEPRLSNAVVTHVPGPEGSGILEFTLSGTFASRNQKQNIFFQTSIIPDGSVSVKK
jgi:type VI secretion system protein